MPNPNPCDISSDIRSWMRSLGYVCEDEIEEATGTTARSRARWKGLKGVMFGNVKWFGLGEIKRYLDTRTDAVIDRAAHDDQPPAFL